MAETGGPYSMICPVIIDVRPEMSILIIKVKSITKNKGMNIEEFGGLILEEIVLKDF
jgi:hypothetical protein